MCLASHTEAEGAWSPGSLSKVCLATLEPEASFTSVTFICGMDPLHGSNGPPLLVQLLPDPTLYPLPNPTQKTC